MPRHVRRHFGTARHVYNVNALFSGAHLVEPKAFPLSEVMGSLFIGCGHGRRGLKFQISAKATPERVWRFAEVGDDFRYRSPTIGRRLLYERGFITSVLGKMATASRAARPMSSPSHILAPANLPSEVIGMQPVTPRRRGAVPGCLGS